ncbi:cellulose binding domain-containing protein [Luedemannella flava]|uniref:cellulose binding domain-containing protein n=1 Tax=Luedemannella flava TaxID=349316 RepID=UPI0031D05978
MGRHHAPDVPPEPERGLRRLPRWLREPGPVALLVVAVLIVACGIWAVVDMNRDSGPSGLATVPTDAPVPPLEVPPTGIPSGAVPSDAAGSPPVTPTAGVAEPPSSPARPTTGPTTGAAPAHPSATAGGSGAGSAAVTGAYVPGSAWGDGFTASVNLTNAGGSATTWRVVLEFPDGVTANTQYWSNAAAKPSMTVGEHTWTFTGATTIPAGGSVTLGFQFDKNGEDFAPSSCTVNGRACG